jgi:hypothetical protein
MMGVTWGDSGTRFLQNRKLANLLILPGCWQLVMALCCREVLSGSLRIFALI